MLFGKLDEPGNQPVVLKGCFYIFNAKSPLHHIEYIAGDLGRQHGKIVGNNDKKKAQEKPVPVLPEVLIKRF